MVELPQSVQAIADVIGREAALCLVGATPPCGRRSWRRTIYIPHPERLHAAHWIVLAIGHEAAVRLSRRMGGCWHEVSTCAHLVGYYRAVAIRRDMEAGVPVKVIAAVHGIEPYRVRAIASLSPEDAPGVRRHRSRTSDPR